jgi:hypothetical protein
MGEANSVIRERDLQAPVLNIREAVLLIFLVLWFLMPEIGSKVGL